MSTQLRYTDRDVRDHPELYEVVEDYLEGYTGEFTFLIDCKMRVAAGMDLSIGMVRGVLNCMRNDPRINISELPEPSFENDEVVVPMRKKNRRRQRRPCDIKEFHGPHGGYNSADDDDPYEFCGGRYAINRNTYSLPMTVKMPFVVARTGSMIHATTGLGRILWMPRPHEFGFVNTYQVPSSGIYSSGDLYFDLKCKHPGVIRNGFLLSEDQAHGLIKDRAPLDSYITELQGFVSPSSQRQPLDLCKRCKVND